LDQARKQLTEILNSPEFGQKPIEKAASPPSWISSLVEWIDSIPMEFGYALWVFACVMLVVGIGAFIHWRRQSIRMEGNAEPASDTDAENMDEGENGDIHRRIRFLFHQMLQIASDKKKVMLRPSKTNGEYREEWRNRWPETAPIFNRASGRFDEIWYGGKQAGVQEAEWFEEQLKQIGEKEKREGHGTE